MAEQFFMQLGEKRRILIVDDQPVIRNLCKSALSGFDFLEASNGREALEMISDRSVDLILTDVVMPEVDGIELLRCARDMYPDQAVIIMTGDKRGDFDPNALHSDTNTDCYNRRDVVLEALKAGASDFIYKPIDRVSLLSTVEKILKQKTILEELASFRRLDAFKNEFLSIMTHKLKTPLTSFSLFVEAVGRGAADVQGDAVSISQELSSYDAMLSDLLRYSRFLAGAEVSEPERVFSETLFYGIFLSCQPRAQKRSQQFEYRPEGGGSVFTVNRERIAFAVTALIENAIKFTPVGGSVLFKTAMNETEISIIISDSGPGVSPKEMNKIFEKFYQVDPDSTGQIKGLGLGLFFARQFVELNAGTLRLEPNDRGGIDAVVTLPKSRSSMTGTSSDKEEALCRWHCLG